MKIVLASTLILNLLTGVAIAQQPAEPAECDPHYEGICLPVYRGPADDVDCGEIEQKDIVVVTIGEDPHRLDRDEDGIGCESQSRWADRGDSP